MDTYIILAALVGVPLFLALLFRVNAVLLFIGVAAGALFAQYIAEDTSLVVDAFFPRGGNVDVYVKLGLLVLPVALTLLFLRKTLSVAQLVFHLIPLLVTSAAFASLVVNLMPGGVYHDVMSNPVGRIAVSSQNVLIAASAFLTLLLAWLTMGHKGRKHH